MNEVDIQKYYLDFKKKVSKKYKLPISEISISDKNGILEIDIIPEIPVTKLKFGEEAKTESDSNDSEKENLEPENKENGEENE